MQQAAKFMHHYNSPPATSSPQQPTPPTTSFMYWSSSTYGFRAPPAGAESPMDQEQSSTSATPSHFDMAYIAADSATEDIPEPPSPYFGRFGVSGGCNADPDDRIQYFGVPNPGPSPLFIEQHPGEQVQQTQETAIRTPLPQDSSSLPSAGLPVFQQPDSPGVEPAKPSRASPPGAASKEGTSVSCRPGRVSKKAKMRLRHHKSRDYTGPQVNPEETIQLRPGIPEEERFLLEQRMKFHDRKGTTMWDAILAEFTKKFNKTPEKAALQMKLTRARQKYVVWSKKDVSPVHSKPRNCNTLGG